LNLSTRLARPRGDLLRKKGKKKRKEKEKAKELACAELIPSELHFQTLCTRHIPHSFLFDNGKTRKASNSFGA
jgi:hypothetical protein